ncbi:RICIN domain-containing protein [Nonomuraea sp. NPDC049480]|uniref:RICIN domain-containing protein n=1 Tax=Nonomuraea sp. NPDC049480 TaxID=3364353 RepID=UPI0037A08FCD
MKLRNYKSKLFLQPENNSNYNGEWIIQESPSGRLHQLWCQVTDGVWIGYENAGSRKNLGIDYASSNAGAAAIQANPSGALNQDWIVVHHNGHPTTRFSLRNRNSGMCLGIHNASIDRFAWAAQFPCDGKLNQLWEHA